jgi:hypothetical protein
MLRPGSSVGSVGDLKQQLNKNSSNLNKKAQMSRRIHCLVSCLVLSCLGLLDRMNIRCRGEGEAGGLRAPFTCPMRR